MVAIVKNMKWLENHAAIDHDNTIIVVHGYKGVYKLELAPYFENLKSGSKFVHYIILNK